MRMIVGLLVLVLISVCIFNVTDIMIGGILGDVVASFIYLGVIIYFGSDDE